MSAIPLIGVIAGAAFLAGLFTPPERYRRAAGALSLAALGAGSLRAGLETDRLGDLSRLLSAAAGEERDFLLIGLGLVAAGSLAAVAFGFLPVRPDPPGQTGAPVRRRPVEWLVLLAGLVAIVSPFLPITLGLAFLAGGVELLLIRRPIRSRILIAAALLLLAAAGYLLATIIGPFPSTYRALQEGPIGDPAARLLVLLIAPAALIYLYTWSLMPAGAALLGRLAGSALSAGLLAWQPIGMPLALAGAGLGVWLRRPDVVALSLGSFGLWSGNLRGYLGAGLLLLAGFMYSLSEDAGLGGYYRQVAQSIAAAGLMLIVAGGLLAQVGYSVLLAVSAATLLIVRQSRPRPVASL